MPDNCNNTTMDCPMFHRIKALEKEINHNKEAHKEIYKKLEESHTDVALNEERIKQIKEDVEEVKKDTKEIKKTVQEIKEKPAKRWDGLVDKAVFTLVGVVITYILARLGLV